MPSTESGGMEIIMKILAGAFVFLIIVIIGYGIKCYNQFVGAKNRVKDQEAQIHVQLKQRCDLVPNLVETVKGCAGFEKETLEAVMAARGRVVTSRDDRSEGELEHALGRLFAVSENYPELKASSGFIELQRQLTEIENKIAKSRQFYNDTVLKYNNAIQVFPANIMAIVTGFKPEEFLQITENEKASVKVNF